MDIRKADIEDAGSIAPLVAKFRDALRGFKGLPPQNDVPAAQEEWAEYCGSGFVTYLAHDGRQCAGYLVCRVDAPTVWVESLYVLPEHRRKGIASALYEQAEGLARSHGEDTAFVYVHPNNDAMIGFLKKRGYDVLNLIEVRKRFVGEVTRTKVQVGHHEYNY